MYQEYLPDLRLAHLVECYWTSSGYINGVVENRILPDGCVDIVFTFNGEDGRNNKGHVNPKLVGTMTSYMLLTYTKKIDMMGIRFNPCGIRAFTRIPMDEITNNNVDFHLADTLFRKHGFDMLFEKNTIQERLAYLNGYLLKSLSGSFEVDRQILFSVNTIKQYGGNIGIANVSEQACLSQRQLERRFKMSVGVSPKVFSRITKFRNAVKLLKEQPQNNLYEAAMTCGYYDHAHLIKEFKVFSGESPLAYIQ